MHLDEERLQRLLHEELAEVDDEPARRHLAACPECLQRLEEARREEDRIFALMRRVDHEPPPVSPHAVAARARRGLPSSVRRVAAALVVLGGAGLAYAAPGSPVPRWVERFAAGRDPQGPSPASAPRQVAERDPALSAPAGVAVLPGERFTILLTPPRVEGTVTVSLTDGPQVVVRSLTAGAVFTTHVDRLTIELGGSAPELEIELPRDAPWVEIRDGDRRLLLKQGPRVASHVPAELGSRYVLPLGRGAGRTARP